ncbi:MAG: hypothetical protein ACTSWC_10930 [Promethearchaeota archaeon]
MAEIPDDLNEMDDEILDSSINSEATIRFKHALSRELAEILLHSLDAQVFPDFHAQNIPLHANPIYNKYNNLVGIEFSLSLTDEMRTELKGKIDSIISKELDRLENLRRNRGKQKHSDGPISFTELLGTFRVKIIYVLIPILISITCATFLGWAAKIQADIDINVAPYPNEENFWQILYNGFMPVMISAIFITVIYFLIKKFGMIAFKIIMGLIIFFYSWYGFMFFITVFFTIYAEQGPPSILENPLFNGIYLGFFYGSILLFIVLMVLFFGNRLSLRQRNAIVLFYSIFMGSIIGISLPTWTTFAFAIFLSIWDLITVFKGPLGKIGQMIQDNQMERHKRLQTMLDEGKIGIDQIPNYEQFVSLQIRESEGKEIDYKHVEIELGSGDLILYSALVANVFLSYGSWLLTGLTIIGVIAGAFLTLYLLLTKKRMLPALPFSMIFGIILFFLGLLLQTIF